MVRARDLIIKSFCRVSSDQKPHKGVVASPDLSLHFATVNRGDRQQYVEEVRGVLRHLRLSWDVTFKNIVVNNDVIPSRQITDKSHLAVHMAIEGLPWERVDSSGVSCSTLN